MSPRLREVAGRGDGVAFAAECPHQHPAQRFAVLDDQQPERHGGR